MSRVRWWGAALVFALVGAANLWLLVASSPMADGESPGSYWTTMAVLAVPGALAAGLLWTSATSGTTSTMDGPARLVAAATATLPADRRDWGAAMVAELAEVPDRGARWRFALGCVRTAVFPPHGQRVLALVVASVTAAAVVGTVFAVGRAVPEMRVFAATFVGLIGVFASVAVFRTRRLHRPTPLLPVSVVGFAGVIGCIDIVGYSLATGASTTLDSWTAATLAAVLAGCLWLSVAPPRPLATSRVARWVGAAAGLTVAAGLFASARQNELGDSPGVLFYLIGAPVTALFVASALVAAVGRSFRAGLQATLWTVVMTFLLTFSIYVVEDVRYGRATGVSLLDGDGIGGGRLALQDAIAWVLAYQFVWAVPFGVLGAGLGAVIGHTRRRPRAKSATT